MPPLRSTTTTQRTQIAIVVVTDVLLSALVPPMVFLVLSRGLHLGVIFPAIMALFVLNGALFHLAVDVRALYSAAFVYKHGTAAVGEIVSAKGITCEARFVDADGSASGAVLLNAFSRAKGSTIALFYLRDRMEMAALDAEGRIVPGFRSHGGKKPVMETPRVSIV